MEEIGVDSLSSAHGPLAATGTFIWRDADTMVLFWKLRAQSSEGAHEDRGRNSSYVAPHSRASMGESRGNTLRRNRGYFRQSICCHMLGKIRVVNGRCRCPVGTGISWACKLRPTRSMPSNGSANSSPPRSPDASRADGGAVWPGWRLSCQTWCWNGVGNKVSEGCARRHRHVCWARQH